MFDLGECLLNRIEVRRIWRQIEECRARGSDGTSYGLGFVTAKIVHDDDVSRFECFNELLLDPGSEEGTVYWTVENIRGCQSIAAQGRQKGHGIPLAVRRKAAQSFATLPPASQRRHIGFDPCLINEHEPVRINVGLD